MVLNREKKLLFALNKKKAYLTKVQNSNDNEIRILKKNLNIFFFVMRVFPSRVKKIKSFGKLPGAVFLLSLSPSSSAPLSKRWQRWNEWRFRFGLIWDLHSKIFARYQNVLYVTPVFTWNSYFKCVGTSVLIFYIEFN